MLNTEIRNSINSDAEKSEQLDAANLSVPKIQLLA